MNQKDRDMLFELMVFWDNLTTWVNDETSELPNKDKNKIKIINDNIMAMMVQYRKAEGVEALNNLLEESKKYKFAILPKDEQAEVVGTMESVILKGAVEKVIKNQSSCDFCDRCDYKNCEWFTLKKFLKEKENYKKNKCPYRNNIFENFEEIS